MNKTSEYRTGFLDSLRTFIASLGIFAGRLRQEPIEIEDIARFWASLDAASIPMKNGILFHFRFWDPRRFVLQRDGERIFLWFCPRLSNGFPSTVIFNGKVVGSDKEGFRVKGVFRHLLIVEMYRWVFTIFVSYGIAFVFFGFITGKFGIWESIVNFSICILMLLLLRILANVRFSLFGRGHIVEMKKLLKDSATWQEAKID